MDKYQILKNAFWNYCYDKGELHCQEVIDKYVKQEEEKYNKPLMSCGHIANAVDASTGKPCCVICNCHTVSDKKMNLKGRVAKCTSCGHITESKETLPFFEYRPDLQTDTYYCGCYGWD